jgi:putative membrane protein
MMYVLADSSWPDGHAWLLLIPLIWIAFFLICARFFWRRGGGWRYAGERRPDAREIVAERYARGEISHEEYRERLGNLQK